MDVLLEGEWLDRQEMEKEGGRKGPTEGEGTEGRKEGERDKGKKKNVILHLNIHAPSKSYLLSMHSPLRDSLGLEKVIKGQLPGRC